jgi:hypothetical protein
MMTSPFCTTYCWSLVVQRVGAQRGVEVVHQQDVARVVEAAALGSRPMRTRICSAVSWPCSVSSTWCAFSSTV